MPICDMKIMTRGINQAKISKVITYERSHHEVEKLSNEHPIKYDLRTIKMKLHSFYLYVSEPKMRLKETAIIQKYYLIWLIRFYLYSILYVVSVV